MLKKRLIAVIIHRNGLVVQSIGFNRYLPIGKLNIAVEFMRDWDVDEIVILDINASRAGRENDFELVKAATRNCFVPITLGGGIRTLDHIRNSLKVGADKTCLNTCALEDPAFITTAAGHFGSQCIVISMDVIRHNNDYVVFDGIRRSPTAILARDWARKVEDLGCGELLVNSVDRDGSKQGYDLALLEMIADSVKIPVVACGGAGTMEDFVSAANIKRISAVAASNIFHYIEHSTIIAKAHLINAGIDVRMNTLAKYGGYAFDKNGRLMRKSESELEEIWFQPVKRT
jgi:cyclase